MEAKVPVSAVILAKNEAGRIRDRIQQHNGAFLGMLGLRRFPDQATLRRLLKRLLHSFRFGK